MRRTRASGRAAVARPHLGAVALAAVTLSAACGGDGGADTAREGPASAAIVSERTEALISLWEDGDPAFGIFVPSERPFGATDEAGNRLPPLYTVEGARRLGDNELLDYLFLNLEGLYDAEAVRVMVEGVSASDHRPPVLVRIPTIEDAGVETTRARVAEVLRAGADGVVIPHIRSVEEARTAVSFFAEVDADVWSPDNPDGSVIAMLMVEDGDAVGEADEIAAIPGYSMLSCGIGSLTRAIGGDREGAEAACEEVMRLGLGSGMPSMMTASQDNLRHRIEQGYLGLLLSGSVEAAEGLIRAGHEIAGRE